MTSAEDIRRLFEGIETVSLEVRARQVLDATNRPPEVYRQIIRELLEERAHHLARLERA